MSTGSPIAGNMLRSMPTIAPTKMSTLLIFVGFFEDRVNQRDFMRFLTPDQIGLGRAPVEFAE